MSDRTQPNPEPTTPPPPDDSPPDHEAAVHAQPAVAVPELADPVPAGEANDAAGEHPPVPVQADDVEPTDDGSAEPALSEVDTALAGEVDTLIEGDYQQTEQALHDDSQAVAVDVGTTGDVADAAQDSPSVDEKPADDPPSAHAEATELDESASPAPPEPVERPATTDQSEDSSPPRDEPVDDGEASGPAPAAEPPPEPATAKPAAAPPVKAQPTDKDEVRTPAPAVAAAETTEPASSARDSAREPAQEASPDTGRRSLWSAVEPHVVRVLQCVNAPVRRLPPPAREVVDWIALSLVFWVPIVWLIALLVVGR